MAYGKILLMNLKQINSFRSQKLDRRPALGRMHLNQPGWASFLMDNYRHFFYNKSKFD